eukprot:Lankesteria_metandrocarpae@DN6067_c0_g1_i1.p1
MWNLCNTTVGSLMWLLPVLWGLAFITFILNFTFGGGGEKAPPIKVFPWKNSNQCFAESTPLMHAVQRLHSSILKDEVVGDYMFMDAGFGGLGDRFRGYIHGMLCGAYSNKATFTSWIDSDGIDVLQALFEPYYVMWNLTSTSEAKLLKLGTYYVQESIHEFLNEYKPPCIADGYVDNAFSATARNTSTTILLKPSDLYGADGPPVFSAPFVRSLERSALRIADSHDPGENYIPMNTHMCRLRTNMFLNSKAYGCDVNGPQNFPNETANKDLGLIRSNWADIGTKQRCCMLRLLYSRLAVPLKRAFSMQLQYVVEKLAELNDAKGVWPSEKISGDRRCVSGETLTECLKVMYNLDRIRPVVAVHIRLRDDSNHPVTTETKVKLAAHFRCVRKLMHRTRLNNPVLLLATDALRLRSNIETAQANKSIRLTDYEIEDDLVSSIILPPNHPQYVNRDSMKAYGVVRTFAEVLTLASADAVVGSMSGFSLMAIDFGAYNAHRTAISYDACVLGD